MTLKILGRAIGPLHICIVLFSGNAFADNWTTGTTGKISTAATTQVGIGEVNPTYRLDVGGGNAWLRVQGNRLYAPGFMGVWNSTTGNSLGRLNVGELVINQGDATDVSGFTNGFKVLGQSYYGDKATFSPPVSTGYLQTIQYFKSNSSSIESFLNRAYTNYQYQDVAVGNNLFPRLVLGSSGEHVFIGTRTAHTVNLSTSDNVRMTILANGNVGIGNVLPSYKLDVNGIGQFAGRIIVNTASDHLQLQSDATGKTWRLGTGIGSAGVNRNFTIWDSDRGNVINILQNNGYVGIGKLVPGSMLDVGGGISADGRLTVSTPSDQIQIFNDNSGKSWRMGTGIGSAGAGNRNFTLWDTDRGNVLNILQSSGFVGIGKLIPTAMLDVGGGANFAGRLTVNSPTDQIQLQSYTSSDTWRLGTAIGASGNNRNFTIYETGANKNYLTINQADGSVGIGTTTPGAKLDVSGDVKISGAIRVASWTIAPDYVFEKDYKLNSLDHVERYINQNKHLPEIPSAKEIKEKGLDLAEMNLKLLKKVEELTLYSIKQEKTDRVLRMEIEELKSKFDILSRSSGHGNFGGIK